MGAVHLTGIDHLSPSGAATLVDCERRFFSKIDVGNSPAGCWRWTAYLDPAGYGRVWFGGRMSLAHRVAYKLLVGETDMELDHLCRERDCVNPLHLEPVTRQQNMARAAWPNRKRHTSHCPHGHAYDEANTYISKRGTQICRACNRIRMANKKAAA